MKSQANALAIAVWLALTPAMCTKPTPGPVPSPTPTPVPTPTPTPPLTGFNCDAQPELSGIVSVSRRIAGRYIVVMKPGRRTPQTIQPLMQAEGTSDIRITRSGYAARLAVTALARILADPNVAYIQEDGEKHVNPIRVAAVASWGLDRIDQRDLPLDGAFSPGVGVDGFGVNIAVVDTGITPNPDFGTRLLPGFSSVSGGTLDGHGHGTHVAGTAAGTAFGVAKKANLIPVRVLDSSGSGSDSGVIRGVDWVTAQKEAAPASDWVINMSLGGGDSPALNRSVCEAIAAGVVVAVAAGNESSDADESSPARVRQALTVAASDQGDMQASFSNYGSLVDIYAPGVGITSDQPDGSTATWNGTSMATPHVAGAAALFLQAHPGANQTGVAFALTTGATADHLKWLSDGSPNRLLYVK